MLGIIQNNFSYDIHSNEKSIIQHDVPFMLQNKWDMLKKFVKCSEEKK